MSPPLAAEYTASPVEPTRPASEAMKMTLPEPCVIICRRAACVHAMGPLRLMARILSQNSGVVSTNGMGVSQPAQFTRMCSPPQRATTAAVIAFTAEMVNRVAYDCVQLHGGYGYMREYPVERFARDARLMTIGGGTSEIMRDIIAKAVLA